MKIRRDFVTNSSSSSFLISDARKGYISLDSYLDESGCYFIGENGQREFGWEHDRIFDFHSRVNFAWIQTFYVNQETAEIWRQMIVDVLSANGAKEVVSRLNEEYDSGYYGYIDHQSSSEEGENTDIFGSVASLTEFLMGKDSLIVTGNDNG